MSPLCWVRTEGGGQRGEGRGKGRGKREEGRGKREEGRGKREEGRGKREEGRGKREEGRGKREEERGETWNCWPFFWSQLFFSRTVVRFSFQHIGHLEEKNKLQKTGIMRLTYCSLDSDVEFYNAKNKG